MWDVELSSERTVTELLLWTLIPASVLLYALVAAVFNARTAWGILRPDPGSPPREHED